MNGIDNNTCDAVSLRLSGLIGVFDLMVEIANKNANAYKDNLTMTDFAFYISSELKILYKAVSGREYY
jgi:hypothetical protein